MGGRALVAAFGAAAQGFMLIGLVVGAAYAAEAPAGEPASVAATLPSADDAGEFTPPASAGDEPSAGPAAAFTPPAQGPAGRRHGLVGGGRGVEGGPGAVAGQVAAAGRPRAQHPVQGPAARDQAGDQGPEQGQVDGHVPGRPEDVEQPEAALTADDIGESRMNGVRGLRRPEDSRGLANQILVQVDGRMLSHAQMICRRDCDVYAS